MGTFRFLSRFYYTKHTIVRTLDMLREGRCKGMRVPVLWNAGQP